MSSQRQKVLAAMAGAGCAILVVGSILFWSSHQDRLPAFGRETYDQAWELWKSRSPANYNISIEVSGRQPAVYEAEVRNGVTTSARRNGHPLTQLRTLGTWSVPGMFNTIGYDVGAIETNAPETPTDLTIRGIFDEQWGYPSRYQRIQWGSDTEVYWCVLSFKVFESTAPAAIE